MLTLALVALTLTQGQVLRVDEARRDGYGAELVIVLMKLRLTDDAANAVVTWSRLPTATKPRATASVTKVPRALALALIQAVVGAKPGVALKPGTVRVERSDTFRRVDVRVQDGVRELQAFSASTDTPPRWSRRTSPDAAAELRAEDAQAIELAWAALRSSLAAP